LGILRTAIDLLTGEDESFSSGADPLVANAIDYFNRKTDRDLVKESYIPLYGTELVTEQDPAKRTNTVQTYAKPGFTAQLDNDMVEAMSIGFGHKVVNAKATLFTEPGNKFSLVHENEETDVKPAEEILIRNRIEGGAKTTLVRADKLSLRVGSSAILQSYANDTVTYQYFDRGERQNPGGGPIRRRGRDLCNHPVGPSRRRQVELLGNLRTIRHLPERPMGDVPRGRLRQGAEALRRRRNRV
jgi:hypothetical protein